MMQLELMPATAGIAVAVAHRVLADLPQGFSPYAKTTITVAFLDCFLTDHANWQKLSLKDLLSNRYDPARPALCLTFDDGYEDNVTNALPVLEGHDCPAAMFITSGFCLDKMEPLEAQFAACLGGAANARELYETERGALKRGSLRQRKETLDLLRRKYGPADPSAPQTPAFIGSAAILELAKHPLVTLGAHSKTHPLLTRLWPLTLWDELTKPKKILESLTRQNFDYMAYPYGGHHGFVRLMTRAAGYTAGFTTEDRMFAPARDNRYAIPRMELAMDR